MRVGLLRSGHGRRWAIARTYGLPAIVLLCAALPHLGQGDWRTDTGRYAAVGLQCVRALFEGDVAGFLSPELAPGEPYFKKPPLVLWIAGFAMHVFGVSLTVARLTTVAAALGCVLATVWLVRAFSGRGVAMLTGLGLALTYEFFRRTREVSLDMWQLLFLLLFAGAVARIVLAERDVLKRQVALAAGAMALALMTKPFVGLAVVVPIGIWGVLDRFWLNRERPAALPVIGRWLAVIGATLAGVAFASAWHLWMIARHGSAFWNEYFGGEVADRASGAAFETEPIWYYAAEMGASYWPWLPLVLIGLAAVAMGRLTRSTARGRSGALFAAVWLCTWFALLSVFPDKAPRYALLFWPAGAWLAALVLVRDQQGSAALRRISRRGLVPAIGVLAVAATAFAFLPVRVQRPPDPGWRRTEIELRAAGVGDNRRTPFVSVGVDSNERARFYLAGIGWPTAVAAIDRTIVDGTMVLRTDPAEGFMPAGEREIVRLDRVLLTRVERSEPVVPRGMPLGFDGRLPMDPDDALEQPLQPPSR